MPTRRVFSFALSALLALLSPGPAAWAALANTAAAWGPAGAGAAFRAEANSAPTRFCVSVPSRLETSLAAPKLGFARNEIAPVPDIPAVTAAGKAEQVVAEVSRPVADLLAASENDAGLTGQAAAGAGLFDAASYASGAQGLAEEVAVAGRYYPVSPLYSRPKRTYFLASPNRTLENRYVKIIVGWDDEKSDFVLASYDPAKSPHANSLAFERVNAFITASRAVEYFERLGFRLSRRIFIEIKKGPRHAPPEVFTANNGIYLDYSRFSRETPYHSPAKDATAIVHEVVHAIMNILGGINNHPTDKSDAQGFLRKALGEGTADYFASQITGSTIIAEYLWGHDLFDRGKPPRGLDERDPHTAGAYFTYDLILLKKKALALGVAPQEFDAAVFSSALFAAAHPDFSFRLSREMLKERFDFVKDGDFERTMDAEARANLSIGTQESH
ncbi:MAG: hypothetical protein PHF00_08400 [Elusimicrobia bacterium]|nr:hypothetical protein [Elusimicrobiota bacterium]